jgi:pimeloyl-ACP methyl ester carboxylesterase
MRLRCTATLLIVAILSSGCRNIWHEPHPWSAVRSQAKVCLATILPSLSNGASTPNPVTPVTLESTLQSSAALSCAAIQAEWAGSAEATDLHYLAAVAAWTALTWDDGPPRLRHLARDIYHTSLARLLVTARENGRFLPGQGILVNVSGEHQLVRLELHDSVWNQQDLQTVHPVGTYKAAAISRRYRRDGWGVPVVVERGRKTGQYREESFISSQAMFAATVLLRPAVSGDEMVLEFFDPLRLDCPAEPSPASLASDISAPFALFEVTRPQFGSGWIPFIDSDSSIPEGLTLIEPYQPGKIPVVMVHGLLSSPTSWFDMANDLRATAGFTDHCQLWSFRYATGKPFLEASTRLRRDLNRVVAAVDPHSQDPALRNIVLVGHSMGGLVCKLQATASGDHLWNAIANQPLDAIAADAPTRSELRELFYFAPQPNVRRVIFLATPHHGSNWAQHSLGKLASLMARPDPDRAARHEQLRRDNPGVFSPEVAERIPTSVDMLNPDSQLLQSISQLPASPVVRFHSISGYGYGSLWEGAGDGVVSAASTLHPADDSHLAIHATHTSVHRKMEAVAEVVRLLHLHIEETMPILQPRSNP